MSLRSSQVAAFARDMDFLRDVLKNKNFELQKAIKDEKGGYKIDTVASNAFDTAEGTVDVANSDYLFVTRKKDKERTETDRADQRVERRTEDSKSLERKLDGVIDDLERELGETNQEIETATAGVKEMIKTKRGEVAEQKETLLTDQGRLSELQQQIAASAAEDSKKLEHFQKLLGILQTAIEVNRLTLKSGSALAADIELG